MFNKLSDVCAVTETITNKEGEIIDRVTVLPLSCIPYVFQNIVVWLLLFAGVGALFFLILGGYKFITSGGDAKSAEGARKTITYAIIGLLLILLSFFIINSIAYFTGVGCITKFGFGCS